MRPEDQLNAGVRYAVIPRVLVFLTRGDEVLLLRGAPDKKLWAGKYNGLGGHIEPGETPYQAAVREVGEEAGLTVEALTLRAVVHVTLASAPGVIFFVFSGVASSSELRPSIEGKPVWVARSEIGALPLVEDLPELLPRVLEPGSLIYGHYTFSEDGLRMAFHSPVVEGNSRMPNVAARASSSANSRNVVGKRPCNGES
ncbi:MAG: NUDIX domain-containing protein [Anaerolineae bacterium]|nr:NUDIX domain-containing protein [Anaerolineae bacterium]